MGVMDKEVVEKYELLHEEMEDRAYEILRQLKEIGKISYYPVINHITIYGSKVIVGGGEYGSYDTVEFPREYLWDNTKLDELKIEKEMKELLEKRKREERLEEAKKMQEEKEYINFLKLKEKFEGSNKTKNLTNEVHKE